MVSVNYGCVMPYGFPIEISGDKTNRPVKPPLLPP